MRLTAQDLKTLNELDNITRWALQDMPIADQLKMVKHVKEREAGKPAMASDREKRKAQTQFLKIQSVRINRRLKNYTS